MQKCKNAKMQKCKNTENFKFQRCRVSFSGLVNRRAGVIGLITQRHLTDIPHSIAHLGDDVSVARPPVLLYGRLSDL